MCLFSSKHLHSKHAWMLDAIRNSCCMDTIYIIRMRIRERLFAIQRSFSRTFATKVAMMHLQFTLTNTHTYKFIYMFNIKLYIYVNRIYCERANPFAHLNQFTMQKWSYIPYIMSLSLQYCIVILWCMHLGVRCIISLVCACNLLVFLVLVLLFLLSHPSMRNQEDKLRK